MTLRPMKRWGICAFTLAVFMTSPLAVLAKPDQNADATKVVSGKEVAFEYTLKAADGSVIESNVGAEPLSYVQGSHQIVSGLEKALDGMKVGETKNVKLSPEEGYGAVRKDAFIEVNKSQLPPGDLQVGAKLQGQNPDGQLVQARVTEIKETTAVLDLNHPLAGKDLVFDVKVVAVREPQAAPKPAPAPASAPPPGTPDSAPGHAMPPGGHSTPPGHPGK